MLVVGLAFGLAEGFIEGGTAEGSPIGPLEIWRNDRMVGLVVGLAVGVAFGVAFGVALGLVVGLAFGLVVGLVVGLTSSQTWWTTLAWLQLQRSANVPAVRLMAFLEDARRLDVLRTVGAVYQFRHASLQDHLADQATVSSAVPRTS